MIDPNSDLFRWGPVDGRPLYVDPFVQALVNYPDYINGSWPDIFGYIKDDKVTFISDYLKLRKNGKKTIC